MKIGSQLLIVSVRMLSGNDNLGESECIQNNVNIINW